MAITVTDQNRATWEARLAQAQSALDRLMTGVSVVELSFDGETVKYTATSEGKLRRWIAEIEAALAGKVYRRARGRMVSFK